MSAITETFVAWKVRRWPLGSILLFLLSASLTVSAQQSATKPKKPQFVVIPRENVLVAIASQPDCPIRIEEASYLSRVDEYGWVIRHKVQNVSTKPIKFFTVVAWSSDGGGGTLVSPMFDRKELLMPQEVLQVGSEGEDYELVAMTSQIQKQLTLDGEMNAAWILMVDKVVFADGSTYKDNKASEKLSKLFSKSVH